MKTIYKYPIKGSRIGPQEIELPVGAVIVHVAKQNGSIFFWAIVDAGAVSVTRYFYIAGTGYDLLPNSGHLGTVFDGPFVWHLMEVMG